MEKVANGIIEDDNRAAVLPGLRETRDKLAADRLRAETPSNVIEIFPFAVRRFKDNIEKLTQILATAGEIPDTDSMLIFRQLIASVIVQPRKPGEDYVLEIKGYL
ncbi:hypothetical protein [Agrobacterium rosae]|uniref:hypothetical protein n=1 Tax=Agrobacterium rosae TaxID=1972867 RepID=UPI003BA3BB45